MEFWVLSIYIIVGLIGFGIYYHFKYKNSEKFIIRYSEIIGDTELEHAKSYSGRIINNGETLKIDGLKLERPYPPSNVKIPSNGANKLLRIVKVDVDRYAYKVPTKDKEVFVYDKDEDGKIIKEDGEYKLVRKKWMLCDDYVEYNVKQWERNRTREMIEKHRIKSKLEGWKPLIAIGIIFIFAIIALKMSSDNFKHHSNLIAGKIEAQQNQADDIIKTLNKLTKSVSGVKEPENDQISNKP